MASSLMPSCYRAAHFSAANPKPRVTNATGTPLPAMTKAQSVEGLNRCDLVSRNTNSLASPLTTGTGKRFASSCEEFDMSRGPKTRKGRILILAGKGFGELPKQTTKSKNKSSSEKAKSDGEAICHCGGGDERLAYSSCCARFHGGVVEPDPLSLLKARYCAFSKGVIPYLIRTTHPENPNITGPGGKATLEDDCKATSSRLAFKYLEIKDVEDGASSDEAFISFRVTYAYKEGPDRSDKYLVEKSRFIKVDDRWLYRERINIDEVSSLQWNSTAFTLSESPEPGSKTYVNPWANSKLRLRK